VIVLAAFAPELQRFRALRPDVRTVEVGIGVAAAAAGTTRALLEGPRPSRVVLLGTCGAYPGSELAIGDVVLVARSRALDGAVVRGEAAALGDRELTLAPSEHLVDLGRGVTCATTPALTTSDDLARAMAATGAEVEHLETHGVALACAALGVRLTVVLGVANAVGSRGRAEWGSHHRQVEDRVGERVAERI
jgi:nucleoside phosphorylase